MNTLKSLLTVSLCALTLSLQGDQVSVYNATSSPIYVAIVQTNKDGTIYDGTTVKGKRGTVSLYMLDGESYWPIERPTRAISKDTDLLFSKDRAALERSLSSQSLRGDVQRFNVGQLFTKTVVIIEMGLGLTVGKESPQALGMRFKKASSSEPFKLGTGGEYKAINERMRQDDKARNVARKELQNVLQKAIREIDQKLQDKAILSKDRYCKFAQGHFKAIDFKMGGFMRAFDSIGCNPEDVQYQSDLKNALREFVDEEGAPQQDKPTFRSGSVEAQLFRRFIDKLVALAEKVKKAKEQQLAQQAFKSPVPGKPTVSKKPVQAAGSSELLVAIADATKRVDELLTAQQVPSWQQYCKFFASLREQNELGWWLKGIECERGEEFTKELKLAATTLSLRAQNPKIPKQAEDESFKILVEKLILLAEKVQKQEAPKAQQGAGAGGDVPKQSAEGAGPSELQVAIDAAIKQVDERLTSNERPSWQQHCGFFASISQGPLRELFKEVSCNSATNFDLFAEQLKKVPHILMNRKRMPDKQQQQHREETSLITLVNTLITLAQRAWEMEKLSENMGLTAALKAAIAQVEGSAAKEFDQRSYCQFARSVFEGVGKKDSSFKDFFDKNNQCGIKPLKQVTKTEFLQLMGQVESAPSVIAQRKAASGIKLFEIDKLNLEVLAEKLLALGKPLDTGAVQAPKSEASEEWFKEAINRLKMVPDISDKLTDGSVEVLARAFETLEKIRQNSPVSHIPRGNEEFEKLYKNVSESVRKQLDHLVKEAHFEVNDYVKKSAYLEGYKTKLDRNQVALADVQKFAQVESEVEANTRHVTWLTRTILSGSCSGGSLILSAGAFVQKYEKLWGSKPKYDVVKITKEYCNLIAPVFKDYNKRKDELAASVPATGSDVQSSKMPESTSATREPQVGTVRESQVSKATKPAAISTVGGDAISKLRSVEDAPAFYRQGISEASAQKLATTIDVLTELAASEVRNDQMYKTISDDTHRFVDTFILKAMRQVLDAGKNPTFIKYREQLKEGEDRVTEEVMAEYVKVASSTEQARLLVHTVFSPKGSCRAGTIKSDAQTWGAEKYEKLWGKPPVDLGDFAEKYCERIGRVVGHYTRTKKLQPSAA